MLFLHGCSCSDDTEKHRDMLDGTATRDDAVEKEAVKKEQRIKRERLERERKQRCRAIVSRIEKADYPHLVKHAPQYTASDCADFNIAGKTAHRAEAIIREIDAEMKIAVEVISEPPVSEMRFSHIERVCRINKKKKRQVEHLRKIGGNGAVNPNVAARICQKIRDIVHFNFNRSGDDSGEILESVRHAEAIMKQCAACREERAEIEKWKRFHIRCIDQKKCVKRAGFVVETVSNIKEDTYWSDLVGAVVGDDDQDAVFVRFVIENNAESRTVRDVPLDRRGRKIRELNDIAIRRGDVFKAYIISKKDDVQKHEKETSINLLPDCCGSRTSEGVVSSVRYRINEEESVEIRIKMKQIDGEACPWNV